MNRSFSNDSLADLYLRAPCGFLITTLDGTICGANRTLLSWTEDEYANVIGRNIRELLSPASQIFYDTHYTPLVHMDRASGLSMELLRKTSISLPVLVTSRLEHELSDDQSYIHSTFFDASERRDSERALVLSKRRADALADVVHSSPHAILTVDYEFRIRTWNAAATAMLEKQASFSEAAELSSYLSQETLTLLVLCLESERSLVEHIALHTGTVCQMSAYPMIDGLAIHLVDVSKEMQTQNALKQAHERFLLSTKATTDGIWDWNCETGLVYLSGRAQDMMGYSSDPAELPLNQVLRRFHSKDLAAMRANTLRSDSPDGRFEMDWRIRHRDGTWRWVQSRGIAVYAQKRLQRMIGSLTDVTGRKTEDPLTGLHSRLSLLDRLEWRLSTDDLFESPCALLFLDLDTFKKVNDGLGHAAGDSLLSAVAERLRTVLSKQPSALAARIGGDEFVILLEEVTGAEAVCAFTLDLQRTLQEPLLIVGQQMSVSASIGIALNRPFVGAAEDLLHNADLAMYRAKAAGRGQSIVFSEAMHKAAHTRLTMEADLIQAVQEGQLQLYYQPKINLRSGLVTGYEALGRWRHPVHGMVSPDLFIAIAEDSNLIRDIGRWTIQESMQQLADWQARGVVPSSTSVSINLSPKQFDDSELIEVVARNLRRYDLSPACVRFEVTEGVLIADVATALSALKALKAIGVGLELDDFGKGYSSLSYLHRYPFDSIKIDRSFVCGLGKQEDSDAIVQTIIALARTLKLEVIAEGIENKQQEQVLRNLGCEFGQGYLYSKAVTAETVEKTCRASQKRLEVGPTSSQWKFLPRVDLSPA
ncbi:MAG: EAL domain-containing protein [Janthinobacterium lividum]